jgi:hypothetical protein
VVRHIQISERRRGLAFFCQPNESWATGNTPNLERLERRDECNHVSTSGVVSGQPRRPFPSGVDRQVERGRWNVRAERQWEEPERRSVRSRPI